MAGPSRYDRTFGEGYYRNAQDQPAVTTLLLRPFGSDSDGGVALCAIDPITQEDHRDVLVHPSGDAVLIVDGVFAQRPEFAPYWDLTVWLDITEEVSFTRGVGRDRQREGYQEAADLHTHRYAPSERLYIAETDPLGRADIVIDNTDIVHPQVVSSA